MISTKKVLTKNEVVSESLGPLLGFVFVSCCALLMQLGKYAVAVIVDPRIVLSVRGFGLFAASSPSISRACCDVPCFMKLMLPCEQQPRNAK